jgi:hypothetical protein
LETDIGIDIEEKRGCVLDLSDLRYGTLSYSWEHKNEPSGSVKCGEFLFICSLFNDNVSNSEYIEKRAIFVYWLFDCHLLKNTLFILAGYSVSQLVCLL